MKEKLQRQLSGKQRRRAVRRHLPRQLLRRALFSLTASRHGRHSATADRQLAVLGSLLAVLASLMWLLWISRWASHMSSLHNCSNACSQPAAAGSRLATAGCSRSCKRFRGRASARRQRCCSAAAWMQDQSTRQHAWRPCCSPQAGAMPCCTAQWLQALTQSCAAGTCALLWWSHTHMDGLPPLLERQARRMLDATDGHLGSRPLSQVVAYHADWYLSTNPLSKVPPSVIPPRPMC